MCPLKTQGVVAMGDFLLEIWRYPQDAFLAFSMVYLTATGRIRRG